MRALIVLSVTALCLAACGKSPGERLAEAAVSAAAGQQVAVDHDSGQVTLKTDKGAMKISGGDNVALPAAFPQDVYLPAGYKIESATEMPDAMIIALDAPGLLAALSADASKRMQAQGWKQTLSMQSDADNQLLGFEKDKRNATVSFSREGDRVKFGLHLASRQ